MSADLKPAFRAFSYICNKPKPRLRFKLTTHEADRQKQPRLLQQHGTHFPLLISMVADFVRPFQRSFYLPTSLVLGTMAAPIGTDGSYIDLEVILNSILFTDFEPLAGFAEP